MTTLFPFLITTIDVQATDQTSTIQNKEYPVVYFHGEIPANPDDTDAVFLCNIQDSGKKAQWGSIIYQGVSVPKDVFQTMLVEYDSATSSLESSTTTTTTTTKRDATTSRFRKKKIGSTSKNDTSSSSKTIQKKYLICNHGFTFEPERVITMCTKIQQQINDYIRNKPIDLSSPPPRSITVIPLIWPSVGWLDANPINQIKKYKEEKVISAQAGKVLASIGQFGVEYSQEVSISIMSHSMGNRLLMSFVKETSTAMGIDGEDDNDTTTTYPQFDHVFMVAADIWEEIFNKRVVNDKCQVVSPHTSEFENAGLVLCDKMIQSKVHVIHYEKDKSLKKSYWFNGFRTRLGRFGLTAQSVRDRVHPTCLAKICDLNLMPYEVEIEEYDPIEMHNYHEMYMTVQYYVDQICSY